MNNDRQLTQAEYEGFRDFILARIGLHFSEDKRHMLSRGLIEAMTAAHCANLGEFYTLLKNSSPTSRIWDQLVSAVTIGETYFFRNSSQFEALARHILPEIMAQREHSSRRIRIWSAGCATGEEPYSVAILLRELILNPASWNILILATDINRDALRKAQEGVYGAWSFRGVEKRIQDAYFQLDGNKQFVLAETIKRMVTFDYLNLVRDPYPSLANNTNAMDIILCRNVTIYFNEQVTLAVVNRFHQSLIDGGWLIPGPSEPNMVFYGDYEARNFPGTVVYQKPVARPEAQPAPSPLPQASPFTPLPFAVQSPKPPPKPVAAPREKQAQPPDPYTVALDLLQVGQADQALVKLYEKIDQDTNFVPAYYTLGKIYANKGNLEEAQNWCERAIKKDKLHPEPYYTLSMIYQQQSLLDMAVEALKKTIYLDRRFILAHYKLAQIYQHQGEKALARKSLENVRNLLEGKPREDLIPEGDGLAAGRLRELVEDQLAQET